MLVWYVCKVKNFEDKFDQNEVIDVYAASGHYSRVAEARGRSSGALHERAEAAVAGSAAMASS